MTETLHIEIEPGDEFEARLAEKMRALDEDRTADLGDERILSVPDEGTIERVLSEKNLELIRTAAREGPSSLRELARLVGRDIKNVSEATTELEALGLLEFVREGRSKRPIVPYDEIEVTYAVRSDEDDGALVA